ncbi:MAG TPA: DUF2508 family protein [Candidatus Monoglobus merdigallinarum]|uniref:DUF2508 family protein n=1 Tax=Candidatus Monoglobus merdigallinarum TaxID=2838698 RepID=A0A9D1PRE4_9FIRM|nr:DUF2508 family protein [Candidatus Monoglobus merdigallinarum]
MQNKGEEQNKTEVEALPAEKEEAAPQKKRSEKPSKRLERIERRAHQALIEETLEALEDYKRCQNIFNFVSDFKLVDASIYDIQRTMSRYEYLIAELKRMNSGSADKPKMLRAVE